MKPRSNHSQSENAENGLQAIQQRAHELYLKRGQQPGRELDDWLQAERELKTGQRQKTTEGRR